MSVTMIAGERAELFSLIVSNTSQTVHYYTENEVTLACPMKFNKYPFDEQSCELLLMDLKSIPEEKLKFQNSHLELGGYDESYRFEPTVRDYEYVLQPLEKNNFYEAELNHNVSVTGFLLRMKRNYHKYFLMYYIPTSKCI